MANMHVLERAGNGYRVVFHVAVPAGTNSPGLAWSTAYLRVHGSATSELPAGDGTLGTIAAAEQTSLTGGTLLELSQNITPPPGLAGAALLAWLDQHYAALVVEVQANLQTRLNQYGRVR